MTQKVKKFTLTAEELEDIAPTLSAALPHPLNILFDDVTDTLEGGDQEVYNAVGFGIGIRIPPRGDDRQAARAGHPHRRKHPEICRDSRILEA